MLTPSAYQRDHLSRSSTIPNLGAGFPLRCFQRLSKPDLATLRCSWQNSRYTRGQFTPVLSSLNYSEFFRIFPLSLGELTISSSFLSKWEVGILPVRAVILFGMIPQLTSLSASAADQSIRGQTQLNQELPFIFLLFGYIILFLNHENQIHQSFQFFF